jgi:integrase
VRRYTSFRSWLGPHLLAFVELKHAGGFDYQSEEELLLAFDRYLCSSEVKPPLSRPVLWAYLETKAHLAPRSRDNVIAVLWPALAYARRHGARVLDLPPRPPKPVQYLRQRQPRILTDAEFGELLSAAARLTPTAGYRPVTTATMLGLLWTTGLRIGEALALDVGDLDTRHRLLTVRAGKFGKRRVLPLHVSTVSALEGYLHHPVRRSSVVPSAPLFISEWRRRICSPTVEATFVKVWMATSIRGPRPRIHDLRHAFAVRTVARWYAERRDVNALLPALSAYLGHVSVENTRQYLVANGALLRAASARFMLGTMALDEVRS